MIVNPNKKHGNRLRWAANMPEQLHIKNWGYMNNNAILTESQFLVMVCKFFHENNGAGKKR
jgi:hypothetical protein